MCEGCGWGSVRPSPVAVPRPHPPPPCFSGSDHVDTGLCDKYYSSDPRVTHGCTHSQPRDPQFLGNKRCKALAAPRWRAAPAHPLHAARSLASWITRVNHEIDIEIPANCMGTSVCAPTAEPCSAKVPGEKKNCDFAARKETCVDDPLLVLFPD